ncbi:flagellar export protein FliJ [Advenella alkanexedens]|mgnify:FL=1|uniref:Flagellar FliJ protein n=1 Tax=Advenella alkanexedens TaxID=1481665 RepID=A0ABS6NPV5_9BURK|nr:MULTISPECIES: flagellar export protein FliJ [Advenella]MBV4397664.1 flagellar export protein FliJ [Advenella alkanexedens]
MSHNSDSFETLHGLAVQKMDDRARVVAQTEANITQSTKQLEMLEQYRLDYIARLQNRLQEGMSSAQCVNFQKFISTLEEALGQQRVIIAQLEKQVEKEREAWFEARREVNSMQALIDRKKQEQLKIANRQEQKMNDEFAARAYLASRRQQSGG